MRIEGKFSFTWSENLNLETATRAVYNIAGLHVEISRHEKIIIFLYLNVISWGRLLLNSVPKIYSILQNNRRHLKVSHNQRINTAEFLRIPPSCGPRIFEACTRKLHKKSKNYASSRGPIEHLAIHLADSTRCLQDDSARGSAGSRMPTCVTEECSEGLDAFRLFYKNCYACSIQLIAVNVRATAT